MVRKFATLLVAAGFVVSATVASPVSARGLLGGLGDTVGGLVNTVEDVVDEVTDPVGETVQDVTETLDDATGGLTGEVLTVNGQDPGLVDLNTKKPGTTVKVGGGKPLATVKIGGSNLLALNLDALGLGADVVIGISDPNDPNGPTNPNNPGRPVLVGSLGGGGTFKVTCAVDNAKSLLQIAANGKVTASEIKAWQRAANVQVIPIKLCPQAKAQIAKLLARSQKIQLLRRAVTGDDLIMASLGRTSYNANDVVAVQRKSGQLVVYVY